LRPARPPLRDRKNIGNPTGGFGGRVPGGLSPKTFLSSSTHPVSSVMPGQFSILPSTNFCFSAHTPHRPGHVPILVVSRLKCPSLPFCPQCIHTATERVIPLFLLPSFSLIGVDASATDLEFTPSPIHLSLPVFSRRRTRKYGEA